MTVAGMLGGMAAAGTALGVSDAVRPKFRLANGHLDFRADERYGKGAQAVAIAAGLSGALLGAGYMLDSAVRASDLVVDTTITSVSMDKAGGEKSLTIPECRYPLDVGESDLFNVLKPGDPLRIRFVVDKNGESLIGWYVAPRAEAPLSINR
jgi:hypothetical protein